MSKRTWVCRAPDDYSFHGNTVFGNVLLVGWHLLVLSPFALLAVVGVHAVMFPEPPPPDRFLMIVEQACTQGCQKSQDPKLCYESCMVSATTTSNSRR